MLTQNLASGLKRGHGRRLAKAGATLSWSCVSSWSHHTLGESVNPPDRDNPSWKPTSDSSLPPGSKAA